jgi:glutamyl endopeptidase
MISSGVRALLSGLTLTLFVAQSAPPAGDPAAPNDPSAPLAHDGVPVLVRRSPRPEREGAKENSPTNDPTHTRFPDRALALIEAPSLFEKCTGWFFGPDVIATAGHCVYEGGWADLSTVRVIPAFDGPQSKPFGECRARRLYSTRGWTEFRDEEYDYGAIKLDCRAGDTIGWFGYGWNASLKEGEKTMVSGYRDVIEPPPAPTLMTAIHLRPVSGSVGGMTSFQLFYDDETGPMTSGAPAVLATCLTCVVAIHTTSDHPGKTPLHARFRHGTLISRRVFENLRAWREAR